MVGASFGSIGECSETVHPDSRAQATNGTQSLVNNFGETDTDIARADGEPFTLLSFTMGEGFIQGSGSEASNATSVTVVGTLSGGGTVTEIVAIDGVADGAGGVEDFQTVNLPGTFTDLTNVNITSQGGIGFVRLDDITISTP